MATDVRTLLLVEEDPRLSGMLEQLLLGRGLGRDGGS
jgi:hypothetical protein